ncbi:hypothetical protein [Actinoplanes siamensis]|uniref:Uncharacterized protein n=1 Tax=Actinoplanes siamensis TaxID=1223317 RepID=A0A919K8Z2_9ACTN|nr:hypothetical protein [Actinoplanes siamensis]GIF03202.1 hypothetical protein Asi03nite_07400 [Actinoplanes siamensis]
MSERRHYPPIAIFHIPECPTLGGNGTAKSHDLARADFPHNRECPCFKLALTPIVPYVIAEEGDDNDHLYRPSDERPADAARSLCKARKGTHGNVGGDRELIEVRLRPLERP